MRNVKGAGHIFEIREANGNLIILIGKTVDEFFISVRDDAASELIQKLQASFEVDKVQIGSKITFNGCTMTISNDGLAEIYMKEYISRLKPVTLSRQRRREEEEEATEEKLDCYRTLVETLMYLGSGVLPQASLVTSMMQQKKGKLRVSHMKRANGILK